MGKPLILFYPNLPELSKNEMQVLDLLIDAGKLIVPIYEIQENRTSLGANFYPKGISKGEIEKAAKKNPQILSPYTVVEKVDGKLVATPYHIKYKKFLEPIAKKLQQAANISNNKEFGNYLKLRAKSLLDGKYDDGSVARLKIKNCNLDISVGPFSRFDDQLFYVKTSYQSWVGVVDREGTDRLNNYKNVTFSAIRKGVNAKEKISDEGKVRAQVLDVVLFSGYIARSKFVGVHSPSDASFIEKYGSEIILFNQPNDLRVKEQIMPTFTKIFSKEFREGFTEEDIRRGYLRAVALHELSHSYLYYKNASKNLQDLFPVIDELAATILGLRLAGTLLLKDRITDKMLESMVITFICRSFAQKAKGNDIADPLRDYGLGGRIFINFMLEHGSIRQAGNYIIPNYMKIFVSLHELSDILEKLLSSGIRKNADDLIRKYEKYK